MIQGDLPNELQQASANYLADENDFAVRRLIEAFGRFTCRNDAHRRAAWLCILVSKRLMTSPTTPFNPVASEDHSTIATVENWIKNGIAPTPADWDRICSRPNTVPVGALEIGEKTIMNAVCSVARFSLHCGVLDAVEAIELASLYEAERPLGASATLDFSPWLIQFALPAAYKVHDLPVDGLHPLRQ